MAPADEKEAMLSLARSRVYAYLAACFRYPDAGSWSEVAGDDAKGTFASACALLAEEKPYERMRRHRGGLPPKGCAGPEALEERHQEVFGHTISKQCPPYETEYGNMHLFQQSDFLADISGFYRAFGVAPVEGNDRLDHVSIQLEFLHLVAFKEARALKEGKAEEALVCREARASFLEDHLGRWTPVFAKRLERKDPEGAYGAAARMLRDFIEAEKKALEIEQDPVPDVSRGELLPMAADEWDSSDWQTGDGPVPDTH